MASNEEILAGLAEIVNEETGLATEAVEMDKSFTEDLDIDSISMMTIVVNAEEKFGVRVPEGTLVAVIGALIGLGGAYLVGRAMQSTLYGVGAMDGLAVGATAALLLVVAWLACLVPALRASRVDPIVTLRAD
jgi:acyl carrier protein